MLQVTNTGSANPRKVNLLWHQRAVDDNCFAGTGNGNIKPSVAAFSVERTEVHRGLAGGIGAKRNGEEDDVSFVALDVFQVLDEQGLL